MMNILKCNRLASLFNTSYSSKSIRSAIILIFARTSLLTPISISLKICHLKVFLKDIDFLFVSLPFPSRSHVCLSQH